jgi:uncharacterized membrane protein YoaK (UPF0700 family)
MLESPTPDRKAIVLLLLAIAGCVDATGLAETGRTFVSFMSGNTTFAGAAAAYGDWPQAVAPLGLVALFVAGATLGTLIAEAAAGFATVALLLVEAALLAAAWFGLGGTRPLIGVVLLPVAMGLANIVTLEGVTPGGRRAGPGVTYATGTLVRIGIGFANLGRGTDGRALAFDCAMWAALFGGAAAGAVARLRFGADALLACAGALAVVGLAELAFRAGRRGAAAGSGR